MQYIYMQYILYAYIADTRIYIVCIALSHILLISVINKENIYNFTTKNLHKRNEYINELL